MAITVKLNKTQTLPPAGNQPYSAEAVELMKAIHVREYTKGTAVTSPGEVFAVLLGMGYRRADQLDIQVRAREFVNEVQQLLVLHNRRSPSYDEVLEVMNHLGYSRRLAG